jgi:hypothetical protein
MIDRALSIVRNPAIVEQMPDLIVYLKVRMSFDHLLRRALWLAFAATIALVPCAGAAERLLTADFDGDGRHDRVAIDHQDPSLLTVWLSATGATEQIRNARPLLRVAALDLDGDHRPELIATDTSAAGLHVWKKHGRRGFRLYHARAPAPIELSTPRGTAARQDSADSLEGLPDVPHPQESLSSRYIPSAATDGGLTLATRPDRAFVSGARLTPTAPRPPPLSLA